MCVSNCIYCSDIEDTIKNAYFKEKVNTKYWEGFPVTLAFTLMAGQDNVVLKTYIIACSNYYCENKVATLNIRLRKVQQGHQQDRQVQDHPKCDIFENIVILYIIYGKYY